ncbi:MAG: hypothetical protein ACE361_12320 [Aureliella sp.]
MSSMELEPWIVLLGAGHDAQPALWQISGQSKPAIAFFSSEGSAERYKSTTIESGQIAEVKHCDRNAMLRLLIECHKQGVELVVLDPDLEVTRKVFQVAEVLRAAREQLS